MNWTHLRARERRVLAIVSGLLLGLAFPPTGLGGGMLAFVALVPLLLALESAHGTRRTFNTAFLSTFILGLVSNYWVGGWGASGVDPFLMFGGVVLALVHPFFLVIPYLLYDFIRRRYSSTAALYSLPIFIAGFEYWHSFGDLSYPWLSLYNTQTYNLAYVQFIEFTGPFALSIIIGLINVEIFQLVRDWDRLGTKRFMHLGIVAALFAIPYVYGSYAMTEKETSKASMRVTVVQPNINPWAKWQSDADRILDTNFHATMSALAQAQDSTDLIIWPETAITFYITLPQYSYYQKQFYEFLNAIHTPLLTGFPDQEQYIVGRDSIPSDATADQVANVYKRHWNAAMLVFKNEQGEYIKERYHKQKLVPLGEHVPFVDMFPVLGRVFQWGVGLGSWNVGQGYEPLRMPRASGDSLKITPLICYESVYPTFVRKFAKNGANLLAVITNDGWYGTSSGPYQHEQFAVLRAIENRRYIARSANTGISCIIDDRGRAIMSLGLFEPGSVTARVPLIERRTLYAEWGDYVAIPAMIYSIVVAAFGLFKYLTRKTRRQARSTTA